MTYRSCSYDHVTKTDDIDCEVSAFMQNITYEVITSFVHAWQKDCHPAITYFIDEGALACDSQGKPLYYLSDDDPAFLKDIAHNDGFDEVSFVYKSSLIKMKTYLEPDDYVIVSEPLPAKIFIHFLAFILRWGMSKQLGERDVHQAILTLERLSYNTTEKQLLDPLTRSQFNILSCFEMTKEDINY